MAEERKESIILDFEVDLEGSIESINSLTKANKALREERKNLNLLTKEGRQRTAEINTQIDKNTEKIKTNVSALEKQKINIGNYKSALDGVHPALGKLGGALEGGAKGFMSMARASLAFIATPIGAVLAALVAVFGLLKSALSQNDALMDKFENVTNAVGVVLEIVVTRVGKLGEALIAFASGDFDKAIDLTGEAFGGLADEIGRAVTQQQLFLDASRNLEDSQRNLRIEIARQQNVITKLIKESKNRNLSLDEQSAKLIQASKLEANLQKAREDVAFRDLVITARRLKADKEFQQQSSENFEQYLKRLLDSEKLNKEEKDAIAEKIVALEEARNSGLVLQQKIENDLAAIEDKRTEAIKKQTEALAEQAAQEAANKRLANKFEAKQFDPTTNPEIDQEKTNAEVILNIKKRLAKDIERINKETQDQIVKDKQRAADLEKQIEFAKLAFTADVLGSIGSLMEQDSAEGKVIASAQALINTYLAATAALASGSEINPIFGILSAAAAVAAGLASVAKINEVQFAEGGWTGPGGKWDARGTVHADEYVTPKWLVHDQRAQPHLMALEGMRRRGYADGGLVSNGITQPINQQFELSNIFKNMPPSVVEVVEIRKGMKKVEVKEKLSKR